jgi:hypothetical protein
VRGLTLRRAPRRFILTPVHSPFAHNEFDEIIDRHVIEHVPITNMDQRWPSFRFTRKFWEFYLSYIIRGKELHFEFEVVKRNG